MHATKLLSQSKIKILSRYPLFQSKRDTPTAQTASLQVQSIFCKHLIENIERSEQRGIQ